jgi:magnesium chelatase family protein
MPGEISLSHRGVLFLDEFPEFPRSVLEALRQPLEDGVVSISRAAGSVTYPAKFLLIAAANPCPCGNFGSRDKKCICLPGTVSRYQKRISGPILDRIDLHLEVPAVATHKLLPIEQSETSKTIQARVQSARQIQVSRLAGTKLFSNGELSTKEVKRFCPLSSAGENLLQSAVSTFNLSARSYFKVIKVARTIADLASSETIEVTHLAEALQYRPRILEQS